MKNRIFAVLVVILMCFSMITPVFAATTTTLNPEWTQTTMNGNVYQINYWHPKGYDKLIVQDVSGSYYFGNYSLLFYNDSTVFDTTKNDRMFITNGSAIKINIEWSRMGSNTPEVVLDNIKSMLFGDDSAGYRNLKWTLCQHSNESTSWSGQTNLGDYEYDTTSEALEEDYVTWYYEAYSMYPPLAGLGGDEEVEFMKYPNYLILQQPIEITGGSMNEDGTLNFASEGFVETMDNVTLHTDDSPYVYVVISSKEPSTNLYACNLFDNWLPALQLLLTEKGNRNNYDWADHTGYLLKEANKEDVVRYYFSSLTEASKFVLYGTAGAKYQYKDETYYGYGYTDCIYNNYEVDYFGVRPVPEWQYPLGKMKIVLRWHNADVYDREYIMIDCNYIPYGVLIGSDYKLRIHEKLNPKFYQAWKIDEENSDTFDPCNWSNYEEIDKYAENSITKFQLYSTNLEEMYVSTSWDVIYSTHDIFSITKDGDSYSAGDITITPTIEIMEDPETKDKWMHNHLSDEKFKDGSEKEYVKQEDGTYENEDGEKAPDGLIPIRQDWLDAIREHTMIFGNIANIIDAFTTILDDAIEQTKPITDLFAAVFKDLPTIWIQIIKFSIYALILSRIIKRGGN